MKLLLNLLVFTLLSSHLFAQPKIEFEQQSINKIYMIQGESYTYIYKFTNTGDKPLILEHAAGNSGDFVPQFSKNLILPGKSGSIKVNYNTKGKIGHIRKTIRVFSNAEMATLALKGIIIIGPTEENPFPVIHFENTENDAGTREIGPDVHFRYPFKNIGNRPLQITRVGMPCGQLVQRPNSSKRIQHSYWKIRW